MTVIHLLEKLKARIPELEWQLSRLGPRFSSKALPRGLFRLNYQQTQNASAYAEEIKEDIKLLAAYMDNNIAAILAAKIENKITVLVKVCQQAQKNSVIEPVHAMIQKMSTRQERVQKMKTEIQELRMQKDKLLGIRSDDVYVQLELRADIGEIERKLTELEEAYTGMVDYEAKVGRLQ